jgi:hypothetical protein
MERHRRMYRALLVVCPAEHRRRYGEAMAQLFADRLRDEGGGVGTMRVWVQVLIDLVKTAFTERLEATVRSLRSDWWRMVAVPLALFVGYAGIGNALEPVDTAGPNWQAGAIAYAGVAILGLGLVVSGLVIRKNNRKIGSSMVAVGVMPGFPLAIMFWYPPIALVGVLSIMVSMAAFIDAPKAPQSAIEPIS